jgi:hypothetical protein
MSDPSYALQVALVTALKAIPTAAGTRVYDEVPRSASTGEVTATFPYISIGTGDASPVDEECWDRTTTVLPVDVWSRAVGFPEAKQIAGAIRDRLHEGEMTITGHTLDRMHVDRMDYIRDPDGKTRRVRLTLEIDTQPSD